MWLPFFWDRMPYSYGRTNSSEQTALFSFCPEVSFLVSEGDWRWTNPIRSGLVRQMHQVCTTHPTKGISVWLKLVLPFWTIIKMPLYK